MKKQFKYINIFFSILFFGGIIGYVIFVNTLPNDIFIILNSHNILFPFYIVLSLGVLSLILNQISNQSQIRDIVYVDRIIDSKKEEFSQIENSTGILDHTEMIQEIVKISNSDQVLQNKAEKILYYLSDKLQAGQGIIYQTISKNGKNYLQQHCTYAFSKDKEENSYFEFGEGLPGLAAKENRIMLLDNIPQGYISIYSGLGHASPTHLLLLPLTIEDNVTGILELALFQQPKVNINVFFKELSNLLGKIISIK